MKIYTLRIIGLLVLSAFLIYLGLVITFQYVKESTNESRNESVQFVATEIHDQIIELKLMDNLIKLQQHLQSYAASSEVEVYKLHVLNKNFEVIASSDIGFVKKRFEDKSYKQVKERNRSYVINKKFENEQIVECAYPIKSTIFNETKPALNQSPNEALGILLVWRKMSPLNEIIHSNISNWAIVIVLLSILLVVLLIGIYVNKFFANLGSISGTAKKLASGNFQERIKFEKNSEFGLLADSFNLIADNLENRIKETTVINKKLEESNCEKEKQVTILSQMAGGVAHEIRNPLGGIRGFAELLKNEIVSTDEKKLRYVNYILDEVKTLECLVQNVLDFARPKPPHKSKVYTEMVVEALGNIVQNKIETIEKSNGVKIEFFYEINPNATEFEADANQLRQVILNLVLNACDALSEKGGNISLKFQKIAGDKLAREYSRPNHGSSGEIADFIMMSVKDNGAGMGPEVMENLFSPFYTTKASGTGLGLSICKKIIDSHGGFIDIKSDAGTGTLFSIFIPAS